VSSHAADDNWLRTWIDWCTGAPVNNDRTGDRCQLAGSDRMRKV